MKRDLNRCEFIGRLGKDPEVKYMPSGDAIANFDIAVGKAWKDKNGETQESTQWIRIVAFKGLAEVCGQFLEKGKQVYIAGEWRTRKWEDKDGRDRYTTEVVANDMQMLGSKKSETQAPRGPDFDEDDPF